VSTMVSASADLTPLMARLKLFFPPFYYRLLQPGLSRSDLRHILGDSSILQTAAGCRRREPSLTWRYLAVVGGSAITTSGSLLTSKTRLVTERARGEDDVLSIFYAKTGFIPTKVSGRGPSCSREECSNDLTITEALRPLLLKWPRFGS
jgi:hypothetical protein